MILHPDINENMWHDIDAVISENLGKPGSIITVLRKCQDIVGYLPGELIEYISLGLKLSNSEVFGVVSFYSLFSLEPKGRNTIKICLGTACYVKGIKEVMARISNEYQLDEGATTEDRRFSLEAVRCLGACGLAPVVVVNDDIHGNVKPENTIDIMEKYV